MEIQSDAFGFNLPLSIEGITCEYHENKFNDVSNEGKVNMEFHSHFSDDSAHNAATTCEHMKTFIHWMYE